jgi:Caspase domain
MANWAVVIGINRYWLPQACLSGAVKDALEMRKWLLDPNGGNVPKENLTLLLAPREGEAPRNVRSTDATKDNIVKGIADLVQRSGGQGERLFFFYAGHGITARVANSDETTIVGTDFTDILTDNSCTLSSLLEFFETTQFQDQFFFIDACRNIPWKGEIVPGRWTRPQLRDPGLPPVQQFTFYATSPGSEAREADERGAFTKLLVNGLKGGGAAKAWSPDGDEGYVVRWDRLVRYVGAEFERLNLPVLGGYQRPQEAVTRGAAQQDPVLSRFPPGSFKDLKLTVRLQPGAVGKSAEVSVIDEYEPVTVEPVRRGDALVFSLAPKTYGVMARADAHAPTKIRPPVDLYVPLAVTLQLEPVAPAAAAPAPAAPPPAAAPAPAAPRRTRRAARARAPADPASLTVGCGDAFAPIEIADATGKVLVVGHSGSDGLRLHDLAPGFYRVRLRAPEGGVEEKVVELGPGEHERITLGAPTEKRSAVVQEVIDRAKLQVLPDNTVELAESVGPVVSPHLSTILTVAGGVTLSGGRKRLGSLGLRGPGHIRAQTAAYVLVGIDSDTPADASTFLRKLRLRLWPMGTPVPQETISVSAVENLDGVGELVQSSRPGPHWLSLEVPGEAPLVLALALLPRRLGMLVVQRDPTGLFSIFQYMPAIAADPSSDPGQLRRLELMQRCFAGGRLDLGHDNAIELLRGKWADPIAGCLGGYLMLSLGEAAGLGAAARNMVRTYPELSDGHLLEAEYHAARGDKRAVERSATRALDAGLPIFADGVSRLLDYAGSLSLSNPNGRLAAAVLDHRVKGAIWSLWTPPHFKPGALLLP